MINSSLDFSRLVVQGNTQDIKDPNYNEFQPGYICQSEGLRSNVCESSSKTITSVYQKAFSNKTKHIGPLVMGFDIPHISEALLSDVHFHLFAFKIENLNIMVFSIGVSNNSDWNYVGEGYKNSFIHDFNHSWSLFFQEFDNDEAIVKIYKEFQEIYVFRDANPNLVWKKIGILTKFNGSTLFGLEHNEIKLVIDREKLPYYTADGWQNKEIMNKIFNYHLKKCILMSINWKNIFIEWQNQKNFLQTTPENHTKQFWNAFQDALDSNIRGIDSKRRILSIIANKFSYETIKHNLSISNYLITEAHYYARINSLGDVQMEKPKFTSQQLSSEKKKQIENFFQNKANVIMSSYKTDSASGLPVYYLKNTKKILWEQFHEEYPDGLKRTAFYRYLQGNQYIYKEDLGESTIK
ncbi:hypothetical protein C1645_821868 [Glomus cerebriforme]|uniref:Uncharacterized protein n=1 Tax=Glomus cerebriforme TaxID=658196 RepID=A0A397T5G3_9GLOM|nr:hypothetical protein C1645_821868 [Glomus cerebriforme]